MKKIVTWFCAVAVLLSVFTLFGCDGCSKESKRTKYDISASLDGNVLTATQTIDFYNEFDNPVSFLKFNIFANAFRKDATYKPIASQYVNKAYKNGYSYGEFTVQSCTVDNNATPFEICGLDKNVLKVDLPKEVFPQERISVVICYQITLANVVARTGVNDHCVNLANFYPILCGYGENGFYECLYYANGDPYFSDCADYVVTLTCDSDFVVASSGIQTSTNQQDGKTTYSYQLLNARSFALVLSKEFSVLSKTLSGVQVNYYYYNDDNPEKSFDYAQKSLALFNSKFGNYPYPTYAVVQTEFVQGGMEFPALVMISDALEPKAYGEVIVHETAHQWWQTLVGNNEIEHGFLDEGLAEYSVVLFYEAYPENALTREQIITSCEKTYRIFCSVIDKLDGKVNTVMLRPLGQFASEYEYVNLAYVKPCIMYDYLRKSIGDERFFKGLKNYFEKFCYKNATPDDLVGIFEKTGADTNGFFKSFFDGKVII